MNKSSASYDAYNQVAVPSEGAKEVLGKDSANPEDSLRKGNLPPAKNDDFVCKEILGAGKRCAAIQAGANGNPHKRVDNSWGIPDKGTKGED
jgi:hypothetical protein